MRLGLYLLLIVNLAYIANFSAALKTKVELVQILFRHGDRTPVNTFYGDLYNETFWAKYGGFGQLTEVGMRQHFDYGRFIRTRYTDFLDELYNKNKVHVRSTDFDRTIMSAQSLLSGLFEPVDFQVWNNDIKWQPIPVHTTEAKLDMIFYESCPRYNELKVKVIQSQEYKDINNHYQDLFDLINNSTNSQNSKDMDIIDLWKLGDVLFVENTHGLTIPSWAKANFKRITDSLRWGFYFDYRTVEMARLFAGGVLNEMRKNLISKVKNGSQSQLYLYSGHDTYVAALTKLLDLTDYIDQPPYTASVILELRSALDNKNDYYVQAYLKNNTADEEIKFQLFPIKGCDVLCPLDTFLSLTKDLIVTNYPVECKSKNYEYSFLTTVTLGISICFVSLFSLILITLSFMSCRHLTKNKYQHQPL